MQCIHKDMVFSCALQPDNTWYMRLKGGAKYLLIETGTVLEITTKAGTLKYIVSVTGFQPRNRSGLWTTTGIVHGDTVGSHTDGTRRRKDWYAKARASGETHLAQ